MDVSRATEAPAVKAPATGRERTEAATPTQPVQTKSESPTYRKASFEPNPDPYQSQRELQDAVRAANERLLERGRQVSIDIDKSTNMVVVSVKDKSGTTVRQIPPEQSLQIARSIDRLTGILVDRRA